MHIRHALVISGILASLGCTLATEPRVTSLECQPPFRHLALNQTFDVFCSMSWDRMPKHADPLVVESSNPQVLSAEGSQPLQGGWIRLTSHAPGFAAVTARSGDQSCTVQIEVLASGRPRIVATPASVDITLGDTIPEPTLQFLDGDGTPQRADRLDQIKLSVAHPTILLRESRKTCSPSDPYFGGTPSSCTTWHIYRADG